ncbi:MAG TPA: proton-conducting transporter membrane subunit [Anaerolineales bacterium]|nr:proton-conducting transporter membrane subunit [Anaerolineales bacterium]
MTVPLLFLVTPAVMSLIVYLLRRWVWVQGMLAAVTAAILGLLALQIPLDTVAVFLGRDVQFQSAWVVLGRSFTFAESDRPALVFIYLASMFFFAGAGAAKIPRAFMPVGLFMLSLLTATIFVQPFLFAALFLEMIAASAVLILSDDEHPATRGALRLLVFVTLGVPFILLAGWHLEGLAASPEDTTLLVRAAILLNIGLMILLAVVPFHSWIPNVADDSSPFASAFVFTVIQAAVIFFMLKFFTQFDWFRSNAAGFAVLRLAGAAMVLGGGALAFAQRKFGRLMGYAVMVDLGTTLLAVSITQADGLRVAFSIVALRGVGLAVWGLGLGWIRAHSRQHNSDDFDDVTGLAWYMPFAAAAVIFGGLSLAAVPLTAGFPGRWALYRLLAVDDLGLAFIVLIASVSVTLAYARGIAALFRRESAAEEAATEEPREGQVARVYLAIGVGVIILLGVFPQLLLPAVARAAEVFVK